MSLDTAIVVVPLIATSAILRGKSVVYRPERQGSRGEEIKADPCEKKRRSQLATRKTECPASCRKIYDRFALPHAKCFIPLRYSVDDFTVILSRIFFSIVDFYFYPTKAAFLLTRLESETIVSLLNITNDCSSTLNVSSNCLILLIWDANKFKKRILKQTFSALVIKYFTQERCAL